jgi:inorganic phosphate transporter, PiT family
MILLFLVSGLFLGWSLGSNDAANVFGSAVGSKMISFRKAAIIASVFVILGAVLQGKGASATLDKLGAVNAIGGAFTAALAAAVTVHLMTKLTIPVSTTQAIVGSIIGWNLFTGNPTGSKALTQIVSTWISGPIVGAAIAILLYIALKAVKKKSGIHLVRFESWIRTSLIIVGAFGAFSLGANNIANVVGIFIPAFNLEGLNLGLFTLSSSQQLFLLGGIAIAAGILTNSENMMNVVGNQIVELSSEAALVVVFSQAIVLFIFSSSGLSSMITGIGLPPIPMVPVSSTQVMIGSIIGIGLYKGVRNINFGILGEIGIGWVATPVLSGLLTFFSLFFVKNIFGIDVGHKLTDLQEPAAANMAGQITGTGLSHILKYFLLSVLFAGIAAIIYFYFLERKKKREFRRSEERFWSNLK